MLLFEDFNISPEELFNVLSLGTENALRSFSNFISPVIVNRIILLFGGTIATDDYFTGTRAAACGGTIPVELYSPDSGLRE